MSEKSESNDKAEARKKRQAEALRNNLKRRKLQSKDGIKKEKDRTS